MGILDTTSETVDKKVKGIELTPELLEVLKQISGGHF